MRYRVTKPRKVTTAAGELTIQKPCVHDWRDGQRLGASTIQRLTREWSAELAAFQQRDLSQADYVCL